MEKRKTSKDKTAYLFKRYIWLLDIIFNAKKISFEDINNRWQNASLNYSCEELPLRTFHNHRLAISEMFDIDITCDRKDGNKYFIEYESDLAKGKIRTWLLNSLSVNNIVNESHRLKDRILFENVPSGQMFLTPIIEAMRESHAINITYQKFEHNKAYTFEIHPYCVKIFKQRWYVVAFNPFKNYILIYSLDRIKNIEPTSNKFDLPEDFNGEEYFKDSFGIIVDNYLETEEVLLKVFDEDVKY
ncbi:MAG: WYL domain-containing protein, partial [Bacteroidaceae bacterium]|nr:WYL domain-containing protein [Bacteroidaceae bacterium]